LQPILDAIALLFGKYVLGMLLAHCGGSDTSVRTDERQCLGDDAGFDDVWEA
jgi:hypothetical protein